MTKFTDLNLSDNILKAVNDKGYEIPSPIQAKAIPAIMTGRDVLAAAQTGTGKTAGFTLPIIQKLEKQGPLKHRYTRVLILTPTRELAAQVQNNIEEYSKYTDINSTVVFGGVGINPQKEKLKRGVDILVATPGRLLDLHEQGAARLNYVKTFVLDEADRMLDMGFVNDIRKVETLISEERQTLLFSATFSKEIRQLTKQFLKNPIEIKVAAQNTAAELVDQRAYRCDSRTKTDLCVELIDKGNWEQVLIFTRTKHGANRLTQRLNKANIHASAIHGDKSQGARTNALAGFKAGKIRVLVATDIAARGIDISQLPHVINFELPNVPEDYVHRIGRTGRAGTEGEAISLVCNEERPFLTDIEKLIKQDIELITLDGFEPGEWPDKAPTTKEVLRIAEKRKQANRQSRGPRRDPRQGGNKSGGSSNSGKSKGRHSTNKKKSSNAFNRNK